jgi:tyrosyl-tRNA synthetase
MNNKDLEAKIEEILTRGVENIYPSKQALKDVLMSGKKLRIYNGIDPTGKLHIGHGVVLKKLRQFQDLGHEVIVLIGDFTARIGDPTDKLAARKNLTKDDVEKNSANYKELIGKILDTKSTNMRFLHNEEWSNKLKPVDMLDLASNFTVAQLLERDMFQERIKADKQIYAHEFLYPLFQAYDSVTMDVDMEIGGNDQTFNMLAGRTLMKKMKNKEKFVLTTKLLTDPSGKKMGKTEGNVVNLDENPADMFGKIMSWPDSLIVIGFEICTDMPMERIKQTEKDIDSQKLNPRDAKLDLASEITKIYHGEKEAEKAKEYFIRTFSQHKTPEDIQEISVKEGEKLVDIIVKSGNAKSISDARRKIEQGGVEIDGEKITDWKIELGKKYDGKAVKVGKFGFIKMKFQ